MVINEDEVPAQPHKAEKQTRADKQPSKLEKQERSQKSSTKVIIRRLPPSMSLQDFITQVSPIPSYNHIYTIKGDYSLGSQAAFSRVYVNFANLDDVYMFKEKFDNYIFIDSQNGHEYAAVVEFAAFQKVPKRRKQRVDLKVDTIQEDPAYIQFIEDLQEGHDPGIKPEFNMNLNAGKNEEKKEMTTPLLDFLKQRKVERMRMREEKREERRKKEQEKKRMKEEDKRRRMRSLKEAQKETKDGQKEKRTKDNEKENKDELNLKELDGNEHKTDKPDADEKQMGARPEPVKTFKSSKFDKHDKHDKQQSSKAKKYEESKKVKKLGKEKPNRNQQMPEKDRNAEKKPEEKPLKKVKKYSERREERKLASISSTASSESQQTQSKPTEAIEGSASKQAEEEIIVQGVHEEESKKPTKKENDTRAQRRIRNKDRPAMQIYKPGMLRKKSVDNNDDERADKVPAKQDKPEDGAKEMASSAALQE